MSPFRLLLLVVVLVACAAALQLLGRPEPPPPEVEPPAAAARPLLAGAPEEVVRMSFHHTLREGQIRLDRGHDGSWRLSEPILDRPEPQAVRVALEVLFGSDWLPAPAEWQDRPASDLGLDPARLVVELDFQDGSRQTLRVGAASGSGEWHAAEREGTRLRLGARTLRALQRPLQEWRDHRLLARPKAARTIRFEPAAGGEGWVLSRESGRWRLVEPVAAPLSPLARAAVARFLGARVEDLRDDPILEEEKGVLRDATVVVEGVSRQVLHLGSGAGWLEGRPYLLALDPGDLRLLSMGVAGLRSRRLLDIEAGETLSLRIERGSRTLVLRRRGAAWAVPGGAVLEAQDAETGPYHRYLEDLLARVCSMEADGGGEPCPQGAPSGRLLLSRSAFPVARGGESLYWWRDAQGRSHASSRPEGPCSLVRDFNLDEGVRGLMDGIEALAPSR